MTKFIGKDNKFLAEKLYECADWLEASGNDPYKVRAYRWAARAIQNHHEEISQLIKRGFDLTRLPRMGKRISYFVHALIGTGEFPDTKPLAERKLNELPEIKGLGSKRIQLLNSKYKIYTKKALLRAIRSHQLEGRGKGVIEQIKKDIQLPEKSGRF